MFSNYPVRIAEDYNDIHKYLNNSKNAFLSVTAFGENWYSTWEDITLSFDVLRGIIEFSFGFRTYRMGSQSKPRAKVPHPKWVIIRNPNNSFEGTTFNVLDYKLFSKLKLSQKHLSVIRKNTREIQKIPSQNSTKQLLISCLRLYSDAMDGYYHYSQFLGLWTIAETICLSEEFGGESKKVAQRLSWFGKNLDLAVSGYSNILYALSRKRNNLVHKGISDFNDDDVNHLKFAVDTALLWLYNSIPKLKTISHLSYYYRFRDLNNSDLRAMNETIKLLKNRK